MKTTLKSLIAVGLLSASLSAVNAQNWSLTGNTGTNSAVNFIGTTDGSSFKIKTNSQVRMNITSTGKIGVGTSSPIWKFDLKGGSFNTDSTYRINGTAVVALSGTKIQLGDASTYIGVGTAAAAAPLHVSSTTQEAFRLNGGTSQFNSTGMYMSFYENNVYRGYIGSYSGASTDMDFGTGGGNTNGSLHLVITATPKLTINSAGNVGIGTTTPGSKLSVIHSGTATATMEMSNTSKGPNISWAHFGASGDWYLRSASDAGKVILQDQATTATVAIGTTYVPSGYKLAVSGKVICSELKVQLPASWPDYVFDDKYSLMSLDDLRAFVDANHHLPGVPSASDVSVAEGVEVGEMQRLLMEKVEELTLYILRQDEKIRQLESTVEQLKK